MTSFKRFKAQTGDAVEIRASDPVGSNPERFSDQGIAKSVLDQTHSIPGIELQIVPAVSSDVHIDDAKTWPLRKKWTITVILSATGFTRIMVSTIMAPALSTIASDFGLSAVESYLSLSVFLFATAIGPLFIGPLSELYGRRNLLHITNLWFLIWNIACGFASSGTILIIARMFAGIGASAVYALAGGVLSDIWSAEQRGRSMGRYLLIPVLGAAVGPILGGIIVQHTTWRWIFWGTSILQAGFVILAFCLFEETYGPVLYRKHQKSRAREDSEQQSRQPVRAHLWTSLRRPLYFLCLSPANAIMSFIEACCYGLLYLLITSLANLWIESYHESSARSGYHYLAICLGELLGAELGGLIIDRVYKRLTHRARGTSAPEYRVPSIVLGIVITAVGLLILGWTAQAHSYWLAIDIGTVIVAFGLQIASTAADAYIMDAFPLHVSSAAAASQVWRGIAAASLPLAAPLLFDRLGQGWGNSAMALSLFTTCIPMSLIAWYKGGILRARVTL